MRRKQPKFRVGKDGRLRDNRGRFVPASTRHRKRLIREWGRSHGKPTKQAGKRRVSRPQGLEKFSLTVEDKLKTRREYLSALRQLKLDQGFAPTPEINTPPVLKAGVKALLAKGRKQATPSRLADVEQYEKTVHYRYRFDPARFEKHFKTWLKREAKKGRNGKGASVWMRVLMKGVDKEGNVIEYWKSAQAGEALKAGNYSSLLSGVADLVLDLSYSDIESDEVIAIEGIIRDSRKRK